MAKTYRELQDINNNKFNDSPVTSSNTTNPPVSSSKNNEVKFNDAPVDYRETNKSFLTRSLSGDDLYKQQNVASPNPFASDYFDTKMFGINFGKATNAPEDIYKGINPYSKAVDFEHLKRESQGAFSAGVGLVNQFVAKTAINTVGGVIGGFYSLGAAGVQGIKNAFIDDDKETTQGTDLLFDNSVNRALDSATDWVEKNNSVFTSQRGRDNATLGFFSFELTKDLNDAFSFISGAISSEMIMGAATGGLSMATAPGRYAAKIGFGARAALRAEEAIGLGNGVRKTGGLFRGMDEVTRLMASTDPADIAKLNQAARQVGSLDKLVDGVSSYAKTVDNFNNYFKTGRGVITGSFWEGGLEARHTKDELIDSQTSILDSDMENMTFESEEAKQRYRNEQMAEIEEKANMAGLATFGLNVGLLSVSNAIQFPTIFGAKKTFGVDGFKGNIVKESLDKYVSDVTKSGSIAGTAFNILKSPILEFLEETGQGMASISSKSYYETQLGTRTSEGILIPGLSYASDALAKGLKETYGTKEGLHEGFIGAIVGAIGGPSLKRNKNGKLRPTIEGGISEALKERKSLDESMKESLELMNFGKFDTLMGSNKDNAIIASNESEKQTLAELKGDKFEVERINDNKIWNFVKDRFDKGLKTPMNEQVADINDMSLEDYKARMLKDDSFTQEQMDKEKKDFTEKVELYSEAYEKVFNGLQFDRINNNKVSKKYFDTLAYAVANEKIYKQRVDKLIDVLLADKNIDLTKEELLQNALMSEKFKGHEKEIDDLIKLRKLEKEQAFGVKTKAVQDKIDKIKSKIDPKYHQELDDVVNKNEDTIGYLKSVLKITDENTTGLYGELRKNADEIFSHEQELADILEEQKLLESKKEKETSFSANKSSTVRNLRKDLKGISERIAEEIKESASESLDKLRGKKDTVTEKELSEYMDLKIKATDALNKSKNNTEATVLDQLNSTAIDIQDVMNELANISKHQRLAFEVAMNLYSLSKTNKAYGAIANAQFNENLSNLKVQVNNALNMARYGATEEELSITSAILGSSMKNIQEDLDEFSDLVTQEDIDAIDSQLKVGEAAKGALDKMLESLEKTREIEKASIKAAKAKKDSEQLEVIQNNDKAVEAEREKVELLSEGIVENVEFDNTVVESFSNRNLHSVKITNSTQPQLVAVKEKLNSGEIKYNSATTITYEEALEVEIADYLKFDKNKPERGDITIPYYSGKKKVEDNPPILSEDISSLDPDVITFVLHAPVRVNIWDKPITLDGETNLQEIKEEDDKSLIQDFMYFSEDPNETDPKAIEKYNNEKQNLATKLNNDLIALKEKLTGEKAKVEGELTKEDLDKQLSDELESRGSKLVESVQDFEIKDSKTDEVVNYIQVKTYVDGSRKIFTSPIKTDKGFVNDKDPVDLSEKDNVEKLLKKQAKEHKGSKLEDRGSRTAKEAGFNALDDVYEKHRLAVESLESNDTENESIEIISQEEYNKRKHLIERDYIKDSRDLEAKFDLQISNVNSKVLFNFRKALLYNKYNNDVNELQMRLITNDGHLEKTGNTHYEVEENSLIPDNGEIDYLFDSIDDLSFENLFIANQKGVLHDFTGLIEAQTNEGSTVVKNNFQTGAVYAGVKLKNGRVIPVLLNRQKIGANKLVFDEISFQLEEYFKNGMNPTGLVKVNNQEFKEFDNIGYKEFFSYFLNENNSGQSYDAMDTLNIVTSGGKNKTGYMYLGNLSLEIDSRDTFEANKAEILNSIADMRFYLNKNSVTKPGGAFDKERFKFFATQKLINHSFNASKNSEKIFLPGFEKSFQLHILNSEVKKVTKKVNPKLREVKKSLNALLGQKKDENVTNNDIVYNISVAIGKRASDIFKVNLNSREAVLKAFEEVIEEKLAQAREYAKLYPNEFRVDEKDLIGDDKIEITKEDKTIDAFVKALYIYKNNFSSREETIDAFEQYIEHKNYTGNYKNILLDKKLAPVKMMTSEVVEVQEKDDKGKIVSRNKFKFNFNKQLTEGSKEENKEKFNNIINSFLELQRSTTILVPQIFASNEAGSSKQKVFLDFSKGYIGANGKSVENVYYHETDKEGNVTKGSGQSKADGKNYNLSQTNTRFPLKQGQKQYQAIRFKYLDENGELIETKTPLTDFEFDKNGVLTNGVIYMTYGAPTKGKDGKYTSVSKEEAILVGSENDLKINNYIKTIKVPGLNNSDFSINELSRDIHKSLYENFDLNTSKISKETVGTIKSKKGKEALNVEHNIKEEEEVKSTATGTAKEQIDSIAELGASLKKSSSNKASKAKPKTEAAKQSGGSLQSNLMNGESTEGFDGSIDPDLSVSKKVKPKVDPNTVGTTVSKGLTSNEILDITSGASSVQKSFARMKNSSSIDDKTIMLKLRTYGANSYEKVIETIVIAYQGNVASRDEMITFVNKSFKKTNKDSDKLLKCK